MSGINGMWPNIQGGFGFNQQPAQQQPNGFGKFTLPNQPQFPSQPQPAFTKLPFWPGMTYPNVFPGYPNTFPGYPNTFPGITKLETPTSLPFVEEKDPKVQLGGGSNGGGTGGTGGDKQVADLSGKGSIRGNSFKTADGERWEPAVKSGETYNLLSDGGVGLNGTYATKGGDLILDKVGLKVAGSTVTLASDGTFKIDGKEFKKGKNDLDGAVTLKNGTYTITTDEGYTFSLKTSDSSGVSVDVEAKNVGADGITPEGLWGVAFDGDKQTAADLKKDIKPRSYEIADLLTFDYEDNNNLKDQDTLDDEDRYERLWNAENPQQQQQGSSKQTLWMNTDGSFHVRGPEGRSDDVAYTMKDLKDNRTYNVFSDEGIQVNGKFAGNKAQQLGFSVDGDEVKVVRTSAGKMEVTVNGSVVTSYNSDGIKLSGGLLSITTGGEESWQFDVKLDGAGLKLGAFSADSGLNKTRSTGLLGDAIGANRGGDNGNDTNGAGYLRDEDGALSKAGASMKNALEAYEVDDLFDTESGRSVYES